MSRTQESIDAQDNVEAALVALNSAVLALANPQFVHCDGGEEAHPDFLASIAAFDDAVESLPSIDDTPACWTPPTISPAYFEGNSGVGHSYTLSSTATVPGNDLSGMTLLPDGSLICMNESSTCQRVNQDGSLIETITTINNPFTNNYEDIAYSDGQLAIVNEGDSKVLLIPYTIGDTTLDLSDTSVIVADLVAAASAEAMTFAAGAYHAFNVKTHWEITTTGVVTVNPGGWSPDDDWPGFNVPKAATTNPGYPNHVIIYCKCSGAWKLIEFDITTGEEVLCTDGSVSEIIGVPGDGKREGLVCLDDVTMRMCKEASTGNFFVIKP